MKTTHVLVDLLARLSPDRLAALLDARRVRSLRPYAAREPRTLEELAALLLEDRSVAEAVADLSAPGLQLLSAGVWLSARRHGALQQKPYWTAPDPVERPVAADELLDFLAGDDALLRTAATGVLAELEQLLLVFRTGPGELAFPPFAHRHLAEATGLSRPAAQLMTEAFNAPEVHRIAAGLDLPAARNRETAQAAVVAALGDRDRMRELVAGAPAAARRILDQLLVGPPRLRTRCFLAVGGYHYGPGTKFQLAPGGSGDPGTDWLAEHGMIVPVGPDRVELPFEVLDSLSERVTVPFSPEPPSLLDHTHPVPDALREAQSAAASASRKAELLLAACAAAPPSVRKVGGLAVRDTRRLAKAIEASEEQTRLWLDIAYNADLLGEYQEPPEGPAPRGRGRRPVPPGGPLRLLPTARYDSWLARSPGERLVPLVAAWAVVPEVLSWWPEYREDTPVALVTPQDPEAVVLRRQLLGALATLPSGTGVGTADALAPEALEALALLVSWRSPALLQSDEETIERLPATLREAELLGVVAHGRLTPLGEGVLALLGTDAADWFPAVPGVSDIAPVGTGDGTADDEGKAEERYREPLALMRGALADLLPPPQETARFQADLTAIAAGAPSAALAELMGSAADRESEGHAVVWRFGPASVRRALDAGQSADDLLAGLREVAEGELPQPLEYLVRDTGRTHGRVRVVRSACCVRSDDEALVLELSKTRVLAKLGLRRIAPTVLISTHSPAATLDALRAAGYAPVLEAETGVTVVERAPGTRAESRIPTYRQLQGGRIERGAQRSPRGSTRALAIRLLAAQGG